jgi:DNA-binding transcriptional LysR family regulator
MKEDAGFLDLRVADAATMLVVHRHGAVTTAARELKVTASQVSKALTRLERTVGERLFVRGGRGLILTESGLRVLPRMRAIVDNARALGDGERSARLSIAAPSYMCQAYLPVLAKAAAPLLLRGLEVFPSFIRAYAGEGLFEVALTHDKERLPKAWLSVLVGSVRHGVFTTPAAAKTLGPRPTPEDIRRVPMISPVYLSAGEVLPGEDRCPLPKTERTHGHEASTIAAGLELSATTGQLVCGPSVAARRHVDAGQLVEVAVQGWDLVDPLYLHINTDEVTARTKTKICAALESLGEG